MISFSKFWAALSILAPLIISVINLFMTIPEADAEYCCNEFVMNMPLYGVIIVIIFKFKNTTYFTFL